MLKLRADNKKIRSLTACLLLGVMLLTACGAPIPQTVSTAAPQSGPAVETAAPQQTQTDAAPESAPEPTPTPFHTEVVLSELQASNKATLPDEDGDFCDWIELYNPGAEACELSGC
jgi:hypothetical protein